MYENIKLIVCDIDGTMVPSHHKLSDYGKEMIQKIKEKNIYLESHQEEALKI